LQSNPREAGIGTPPHMTYKVFIDDNYHYMDESERITHGEFDTLEAAIEACKKIVNDCLAYSYEPGMTAAKLYESYSFFGEDPWIMAIKDPSEPATEKPASSATGTVLFSAWTYAKQRCIEMCPMPPTS
jgi:hypothetical protein